MTEKQAEEKIRKALDEDQRSLTEIARLSGIHRVNLHHFKSQRRTFSLDLLKKLGKVLGLNIQVTIEKAEV